jgi:hypothetical protein
MARPRQQQGTQKIAISVSVHQGIIDKAIGLNAAKGKSRSAVIEMALIKLIECETAFNNLLKAQNNG